jgi:hypothetical protein
LDKRVGWRRAGLHAVEAKEKSLALSGIKPRFFCHSTPRLVNIMAAILISIIIIIILSAGEIAVDFAMDMISLVV